MQEDIARLQEKLRLTDIRKTNARDELDLAVSTVSRADSINADELHDRCRKK